MTDPTPAEGDRPDADHEPIEPTRQPAPAKPDDDAPQPQQDHSGNGPSGPAASGIH